ncbi:MAG: YIP1 family protein [Terriglobales bacterium]
MAAAAIVPPQDPQQPAPLSEPQRIIDTFIAPSKTFADLRRNASWWAPFVLIVIIGYIFIYAVDQKVTFQTVVDNAIKMQPKAQERLEGLSPEKRQDAIRKNVTITKFISYAIPVFALIIYLVFAGVIFASIKFGANAEVQFGAVFALIVYTRLPELLRALLSSASLFAGASTDSFDINNPLATNGAYFMDPSASPILRAFVGSFDIITIWTLVLVAIGIPCIAKVKRSTAFGIVAGWFIFTILVKVGLASLSA